jgi:DNA-directed RNA polymerase specialized sigma24 family protein
MPDASDEDPAAGLGCRLVRGNSDVLADLIPFLAGRTTRLRLAGRFGLDLSELDDIVAVALYKVWSNRALYDPDRGAFGTWCDVILKRSTIDFVRKRARQLPGRSAPLPAFTAAPPSAPPTDRPVGDPLRSLLDALTPTDRRILEAAGDDPDGNWAARLAPELGRTAVAVRVRRLRIVQRIRAELVGLGFPLTSEAEIRHALARRPE